MATFLNGNTLPDSQSVLNFNRVDLPILISDVLDATPFLKIAAARGVDSHNFRYTKLTANPTVGYREINDGVENEVSSYTQISQDLKFIDASFHVDKAAAQVDERGVDHLMGIEAMNHLRAAMRTVEDNLFQVGVQASLGGFDGFANQTNLDALADAQVVNAGGSGSNCSSVWAVKFGAADFEVLWGEGGEISVSPRQMVQQAGSATGQYWSYAHDISTWVGAKYGSIHSVHRLCNINPTEPLTDDLLAELYSACPIGYKPDVFVMNRRSEQQLRESRQATNIVGAPAPYPNEVYGVDIVVTDAILSTETALA